VVGKVTAHDATVGSIEIGDLTIDYSASLATRAVTVSIGQLIGVRGVQTGKNMPLQASELVVLAR
jgi:hypothetical protein